MKAPDFRGCLVGPLQHELGVAQRVLLNTRDVNEGSQSLFRAIFPAAQNSFQDILWHAAGILLRSELPRKTVQRDEMGDPLGIGCAVAHADGETKGHPGQSETLETCSEKRIASNACC